MSFAQEEINRLKQEASKSKNSIAAILLYKIMSDISESHYCAGWINNNEYNLWDILNDENRPCNYGMYPIEDWEYEALKWLSEQCEGWWYWNDNQNETFCSIDEWKVIYNSIFNH